MRWLVAFKRVLTYAMHAIVRSMDRIVKRFGELHHVGDCVLKDTGETEMSVDNVEATCEECGATDLRFNATARHIVDSQSFEMVSVDLDSLAYCETCEGEVNWDWKVEEDEELAPFRSESPSSL